MYLNTLKIKMSNSDRTCTKTKKEFIATATHFDDLNTTHMFVRCINRHCMC